MPRINVYDLDLDELDSEPLFEPIRRDNSPVSDRQPTQRLAEDRKNHYRKIRQLKERA